MVNCLLFKNTLFSRFLREDDRRLYLRNMHVWPGTVKFISRIKHLEQKYIFTADRIFYRQAYFWHKMEGSFEVYKALTLSGHLVSSGLSILTLSYDIQ